MAILSIQCRAKSTQKFMGGGTQLVHQYVVHRHVPCKAHLYPRDCVYRWCAPLFVTRTCSDTYLAPNTSCIALSAADIKQAA